MKTAFLTMNTCVVGTGAAGFNAAIRMKQFGCSDVAIVTEGINAGTSRNTGSDKQTYYKLGLCGSSPDSVYQMAEDLFAGGCVDGDNALAEAALSARCFLHLCELGVPFPTDRFGQYVGYKTDHDPFERATSAGPLTSKYMTECLERKAMELGIRIHDGQTAVQILKTDEGEVCGLITVGKEAGEPVFTVIRCKSVILATGGPAGIYQRSVYPECHHGSTGLALEAGALGQNLPEWQYGLASTAPRWNVSGTYMQVLPRFISVDTDGTEHEFLTEFFPDTASLLSAVFLKGYQWPFDCGKVNEGSSVIDLLVYREEMMRGRKVYLDYRTNPCGVKEIDYSRLAPEAREYLEKAHACFGTPIERLEQMNAPAVQLYLERGVDLHAERLPISLCAQHNNGGIAVDLWWQTAVPGLFVCGEEAGTHGITRPGGSALNAGQVGSLRAAQYAAANRSGDPIGTEEFEKISLPALRRQIDFVSGAEDRPESASKILQLARERMSRVGAAIRDPESIGGALLEAKKELKNLDKSGGDPLLLYRLKDVLITQIAYLSAMAEQIDRGVGSRGSYLVYDPKGTLREGLEECFRFSPAPEESKKTVQNVSYKDGECTVTTRPVRPIPKETTFFENVWKSYRENGNIF